MQAIAAILKHTLFLFAILSATAVTAQNTWPREIPLQNGGSITIYQPEPESYSGNRLSSRAAVSVKTRSGTEPIFGAIWAEALLQTDKDNRTATLESLAITDAKFPGVEDSDQVERLRQTMETEIPKWKLVISLDRLLATLDQQGVTPSAELKNDPPEIIYATQPSALVLLDGDPIVSADPDLKMDKVQNSPNLIVKNPDDNKYYLYGGKFWYTSPSVTSGWKSISSLPKRISALDKQMKQQEKEEAAKNGGQNDTKDQPASPPAIIVRTTPAELIQSQGEAQFKTVQGTSLLYISNSDNDIFKDINSQDNYVVISGRWYRAPTLNGPWTYVEADKLPPDFAKIPEGSDKDGVLANVAGTDESREAVLDASIPQTAKVDRKTATTKIDYDGDPAFESVDGTDLAYATNSSNTVLMENAKYYAVDNGVWFESSQPGGPWQVATERPGGVDNIPPSCPVYNVKYVYIYDQTPDYVYVGYTPGYLNSYIYGPTVVYGTGWRYRPWYRRYYYPRPLTWGFCMHYNPWRGYSMSLGFSIGFFNFFLAGPPAWPHYHGGWFGPPAWRPPYRPPHWAGGRPGGGYYGPNRPGRPGIPNRPGGPGNAGGGGRPGGGRPHNNLYNNHRGVTTRDVNRGPGQSVINRPGIRPGSPGSGGNGRPGRQAGNRLPPGGNGPGNGSPNPGGQPGQPGRPGFRPAPGNSQPGGTAPTREARPSRQPDNVFTDRQGNVFEKDKAGNFEQRDRSGWKPVNPATTPSLPQIQRDNQQRERGENRAGNFQQQQRPAPAARPAPRPAPAARPTPSPRPGPSPSARPSPGGGRPPGGKGN